MSLKTYSLKNVVCTFGPVIFNGFAEDDAITLTPESEIFTSKVGADGQTTRSRSNNDNYKATIRLMATSAARFQLQEQTLRNSALNQTSFVFTLNSPDTQEFYLCANAYVEKLPDASFGREASEREYTIYLPSCKVTGTEVMTSVLGLLP